MYKRQVETRTELDWAMKNGQICVWAPSKIVLDAVDGPSARASDAVALAAWFAQTFDAKGMLVIGSQRPEASPVPLWVMSSTAPNLPAR